jgi:hypothetical protein
MRSFELLPRPHVSMADHFRDYSRVISLGTVPRPDVMIWLRPVGTDLRNVPVLFTVDSGADFTILPRRFAASLRITVDGVRPRAGSGAGGMGYEYLDGGWTVEADLCGQWTEIPVRFFASDQARHALLGRKGAFDALELVFVQAQCVIYARRV